MFRIQLLLPDTPLPQGCSSNQNCLLSLLAENGQHYFPPLGMSAATLSLVLTKGPPNLSVCERHHGYHWDWQVIKPSGRVAYVVIWISF